MRGWSGVRLAGPSNNLIILNESVGRLPHHRHRRAASDAGTPDSLQLSTSLIQNTGDNARPSVDRRRRHQLCRPVNAVRESASLTFNNATGSGTSTLRFFG